MGTEQIVITTLGLGLSVFVIWFFFFSKREEYKAETTSEGIQDVIIRVKGGYDPDIIVVKFGKPVHLHFYRDETADCSEQVVFPYFKKSAFLAPFQKVSIEINPDKVGEFDFTCGMGMLRGKLIVQ